MRNLLPILLATLTMAAMTAGCQDTSTSAANSSATTSPASLDKNPTEWADNEHPCPLLGIPTTVRYEIQSGTERQYRVHLINTAEAPVAGDCQHQQPLPGNVVMRYRLASRA